MSELSDFQFFAFVLFPQNFDSSDGLAFQKHRSSNFIIALACGIDQFT